MKTRYIILIAIGFILGALTSNIYASQNNLIMIPDTIKGYSTIDLLNYVADLKSKDTKTISTTDLARQYIANNPPPVCQGNSANYNRQATTQLCNQQSQAYNKAMQDWIKSNQ